MVPLRICLDNLHRFQLLEACFLCNLILSLVGIMLQVSYVSDVTDIAYLVAEMFQEFEKHIVSHSRTGVPQMGVAVDGRAADIHAYVTGINGNEKLLFTGKGICQKEISHFSMHCLICKIRNIISPIQILVTLWEF